MSHVKREVLSVPLEDILLSDNSRQEYDAVEMEELMVSMRQTGLLQPIGVSALANEKYRLVFGFRRYFAAKKLGWRQIDATTTSVKDLEDGLIKNSIENVQRANVSMPEQGRIFTLLLKQGLTSGEVAARIGCSKNFVMNSMDAYQSIPQKFREKITHGTRGAMDKKGTIPVTVALKIKKIHHGYHLKGDEANKLYEWATDNDVTSAHINAAGRLIASGVSVPESIKQCDDIQTFSLTFAVKKSHIRKLEQKFGRTLHEMAYAWMEQSPNLQIIPCSKRHEDKPFSSGFAAPKFSVKKATDKAK